MTVLAHFEGFCKFEQRWVPPDHIPHLQALAPRHHVGLDVDPLPANAQVAQATLPGQRLIALTGRYENLARLNLALHRRLKESA